MDEEVRQFRDSLLSEVKADAEIGGDYERTRFIDHACGILEVAGEFLEYGICRVESPWRNSLVRSDAYSFSEADGVASIMIADYDGSPEPAIARTEEIRRMVEASHRFVHGSIYSDVVSCWDESNEAHALARQLFEFSKDSLTKLKIYVISDRPVAMNLGRIQEPTLGSWEVEVQIWDIARLARADMSSTGRESIVINFIEEYGDALPALAAGLGDQASYSSFMCVVPGRVLASLYDKFGGRILEQNVRAFLGEGRKVNRGIRETLRNSPDMFFAFNNGLTATASSIELTDQMRSPGQGIRSITDFQIVNGGQTTASLYWAMKGGIDLSAVFVQMKLSRVPEAGFEESVHNIARFANAQNAVSSSDLFAGHPYFKRLESLSRRALAPPSKVGDIGSYWYFERTQGSYNVELRRLRGVAARAWELMHPKKQRITKTDLARYEVTWAGHPHSVCSGAQKNTAAFGKMIERDWAANPEAFDSDYFKAAVARGVLVRSLDARVPAQPWYPGAMLRQLVTYTCSIIGSRLGDVDRCINYEGIWRSQMVPPGFMDEALRIAELLVPYLQNIPEEHSRNRLVTEWAKREACWVRIRESEITLSEDFVDSTICLSQSARALSWSDKARAEWRNGGFKRLHEWNKIEHVLTQDEADLVERAAITSSFEFKGFRLIKLKEAWRRAVDAGFV
jgi:hypothetical protein